MEPAPTTQTDYSYLRHSEWERSWRAKRTPERPWLHLLLFVLTVLSTAATWTLVWGVFEDPFSWTSIAGGLGFAVSLLLFLTVHEFGHYLTARYHRIDASLPYYIPLPLIGIGTFGAVIRIREPIPSTTKLFDVGAAGPLAGFVVALGVLLYGLFTLPPPEYVLDFPGHDALKAYVMEHGQFPKELLVDPGAEGGVILIGQTPLYWMLSQLFPNVPPMSEMYHYPVVFAGWLGLFFTALNMLPVGQLDGGHILYALVGPTWHSRIARGFLLFLMVSGGVGFITDMTPVFFEYSPLLGRLTWLILAGLLYFCLYRAFEGDHRLIAPMLLGVMGLVALAHVIGPAATQYGYWFWLVWAFLIVLVIRVEHPPVLYNEPLTPLRRMLGLFSFVIFLLCFSITPLYVA